MLNIPFNKFVNFNTKTSNYISNYFFWCLAKQLGTAKLILPWFIVSLINVWFWLHKNFAPILEFILPFLTFHLNLTHLNIDTWFFNNINNHPWYTLLFQVHLAFQVAIVHNFKPFSHEKVICWAVWEVKDSVDCFIKPTTILATI